MNWNFPKGLICSKPWVIFIHNDCQYSLPLKRDSSKKFQKSMQTSEVKTKAGQAKTDVWAEFARQFPNADLDQFAAYVEVDEKNTINTEIFFKEGPGSLHCVRIGENSLEWANKKRTRRGLSLSTFTESTNEVVIPCCRFHGGGSRPQEIVKRSD